MANPAGSLSLSDLDTRLVDALRDSSVASATRYMYLQDAYSRIWYKYPWVFRHQTTSFTASAGVRDYTLSGQIDELAALFNTTQQRAILMNKGIYMYFESYADDNHVGPLYTLVDYYEDGPDTHVAFQETPSAGSNLGHGDTITVYYCRRIIHNLSAGTTATGNLSSGTDVPSFSPAFHPLIVKEALCEAIKNRRDFQEMYQLVRNERDEMLADMKRHYLTPRRGNRAIIYR